MVRALAVPMIATSATSLLLAGLFGVLFVRVHRRSDARLDHYFAYGLLAATNAVFLAAFAAILNASGDATVLNVSNRITIIAAMFTVAFALYFFCSFYSYAPPLRLRWIFAINVGFSILCAIPSPLFLGATPLKTSRYYTGLEFGPLFQLWGAYVLAISVYGLIILVLISWRRRRRRGDEDRPAGLLLASCTVWLLTGIADDLTALRVVDLPPMTWLGSFLITIAIAWVLVKHVESLYDDKRALYQQLIRDHLTSAYSRRFLELRLAEVIRSSSGDEEAAGSTCVALVDVDDFKVVNDTHGHAVGDEVLRRVTRAVMSCVRDTDVVARFGGDELALLLERVGSDERAREIVERVRRAVAACRVPASRGEVAVTCSIGVSRLGRGSTDPRTADDLLMAADAALYAAKAEGKNAIVIAASRRDEDAEPSGS